MKQALYYAIRKSWGYNIVAITSEKGSRRWFGRDCRFNEATNGTSDQLLAKFKTEEAANATRAEIKRIDEKFDEQIKQLRNGIDKLNRDCRKEVRDYLEGNENVISTNSG